MKIKNLIRRASRLFGLSPRRRWLFLIRIHPFQIDTKLLGALPQALIESVNLCAEPSPSIPSGRLATIWKSVGNSNKWHHYFEIYERAFSPFVNTPARFLEIGVNRGGSLRMWKSYLGLDATVVGIDINPDCARYDDSSQGIHVRIGSQVDISFLRALVDEFGPFDCVVDDGSHRVSHMITTFAYLFDVGLSPGGVYLVEDIRATYWDSHRDIPYAFSDFVALLMDLMHAHYWSSYSSLQFTPGAKERHRSVSVPRISTLIDRIEIGDGVVTIFKSSGPRFLPVSSRS